MSTNSATFKIPADDIISKCTDQIEQRHQIILKEVFQIFLKKSQQKGS